MKQMSNQKGFTLVELAIVMTIIGLLIGGVLKGQELMENARVTSTVAQVKGYEGAAMLTALCRATFQTPHHACRTVLLTVTAPALFWVIP